MHVDHQPSEGRALRGASVCTVDGRRCWVPFLVLFVRRVHRVNKRVDYGVFEILILELLAKHKSIDEQLDLLLIASSVTHILTAEYAAPIYPLDVEREDSRIIVRKWDSTFLAFFPMIVDSCRKKGRLVAEQVLVYRMLGSVRPDEHGQRIFTIVCSTSDERH